MTFESTALDEQRHDIRLGAQRRIVSAYAIGRQVAVFADEGSVLVERADAFDRVGQHTGTAAGGLTAPMPGKIVSFLVQAGQPVRAGQPLAVIVRPMMFGSPPYSRCQSTSLITATGA